MSRLLIEVAAAALAVVAAWAYGQQQFTRGEAAEALRAGMEAALERQETQGRIDEARDQNVQLQARLRASAAAARDELERLRHADVPVGAAAEPGSDADAAATYRRLFDACRDRYAGVADAAGGLAGTAAGLQGYVRAVTGRP